MSSSVDRRIVEMKFDNAQFERGVSQTKKSLSELDDKLKFNKSKDGFEAITKNSKKVDMSSINQAVDNVNNRFSTMGVITTTVLSRITNASIDAGKKILGSLTNALIEGGIRRAENIEQAKFQLEGLGVAWEDVADDINYAVDGTAYGLDVAAKAASQLIASNVTAGDSMKTALRGISGVAAMTSSSYEDISRIFTTVAGNGRLMGDQLLQISSRGINAAASLVNFFNGVNNGSIKANDSVKNTIKEITNGAQITESELRDFVSKGKINFEVFAAAMDDAFGEHAKDANKVFSGALANMRAALARIGADFASPALENLRDIFNALRVTINDTHKALKPFIESFNKLEKEITDKIVKFVELNGLRNIVYGIGNIFDGLLQILKTVSKAFTNIFPPKSAEQLVEISEKFYNLTKNLKLQDQTLENLKNTFSGIFSIFRFISPVIKSSISLLANLLQLFGFFGSVLLGVTGYLGEFITNLVVGREKTNLLAKTILVTNGIVIDVVRSIINVFKELLKSTSNIVKGITNALDKIISAVGNALGKLFETAKEAIVASAGITFFIKRLTAAFYKIKRWNRIIDGLINGVKSYLENFDKIIQNFSLALTNIRGILISFARDLKADALLKIAAAVGILAFSMALLSSIDTAALIKSLTAVSTLFGELMLAIKLLDKTIFNSNNKGFFGMFAKTFKMDSLVNEMIKLSASVFILAISLKKIADLKTDELIRGLLGIAALFGILLSTLKILDKMSLDNKSSKNIGELIAISASVYILAQTLQKIAKMSWEEIAKGLVGLGGVLAELTGSMVAINTINSKISLKSIIAIIAIAASTKTLAYSLQEIAKLSWEEIAKGLVGLGGALAELMACFILTGKMKSSVTIKSIFSLLAITAAAYDLSKSLQEIGKLSWTEIAKGLIGLAGALAELMACFIIVGKLKTTTTLKSIISLLAIAAVTKTLSISLQEIGKLSWGEIAKGLIGLGGALVELLAVVIILGIIGEVFPYGLVLAGGVLLIACDGLVKVANALLITAEALQKLGNMSWKEIGKSLVAMIGALSVLGAASFINLITFIGSSSLEKMALPLGTLADSIKKWENIKVNKDIGKQLMSLSDGVASLTTGIIGSVTIGRIAAPLGTLADSVNKWKDVEVNKDIGKQLVNLSGGVASLTSGVIGQVTLNKIAIPLGTLSDSVRKWDGVKVNKNIGSQLTELSEGVASLTSGVIGQYTLNKIAEPLGTLADSVRNWQYIEINDKIGKQLYNLALGLEELTFGFIGSSVLEDIPEPLGLLADSVRKWQYIELNDKIGEQLSYLALGLEDLTFGLIGSSVLEDIPEPLGLLADSVSKWKDVEINEDIGGQLYNLAEGLTSLTKGFFGSWTLENMAEPLGALADSMRKWEGVNVPTNLGTNLKALGSGITSLTFGLTGSWVLENSAAPLGTLADSIRKWDGVKVPDDIGKNLSQLGGGIAALSSGLIGQITLKNVAEPLGTLADSVRKWDGVKVNPVIGSQLINLAEGISALTGGFFGGSSVLNDIAVPLSNLSDSVRKWDGVTVNKDIGNQLTNLAGGLSTLTGGYFGGTTVLEDIIDPLGMLPDSIKKWENININKNIGEQLTNLAIGLATLTAGNFGGSTVLEDIIDPLGELPDSLSKWKDISDASNIYQALTNIAKGLVILGIAGKFDSALETLIKIIFELGVVVENMALKLLNASNIITMALTNFINVIKSVIDIVTQINSITIDPTPIINAAYQLEVAILGALQIMISSIYNAINIIEFNIPILKDKAIKLIDGMISAIETTAIFAGWRLAIAIYNIVKALADAVEFMMPQIKEQGKRIIDALFGSAEDTANSNSGQMNNIGGNTVGGIIGGIFTKIPAMKEAIASITNLIPDTFKKLLGIHSPSTVMAGLSKFVPFGVANGIRDNMGVVEDSMDTMADTITEALSNVVDNVDDELDLNPTITPVIDLSEIESGASRLNTMIASDRAISVGGQFNGRMYGDYDDSSNQNGKANVYNFTQNNYSPKALSRIDIYRQTRNQFAMAKGVI